MSYAFLMCINVPGTGGQGPKGIPLLFHVMYTSLQVL